MGFNIKALDVILLSPPINKLHLDKRKISYSKRNKKGSYSNPYLKQGDLIAVGNNIFSISAEAITEITAPFEGLYSTYSLYELITE